MRQLVMVAITALFLVASQAQAQISADVKGTIDAIMVDGNPNEPVWATVDRLPLKHDHGMQLTHGAVDDHNDASGEFSLLWNDEGLFCASWCKDDIHNAPWTNQPGMTSYSWQDDGHEWWVSFDFNDVWEDASPPYYGQFGWQVWKGWTWENDAPVDNYVAYRNDNEPQNSTTADLKEQGFEAPFTSTDGINFNTEACWKWSSFLLGSMSTPDAGKELGFNIGLTDNDGGTSGDGWIRWAEGNHGNYQGWGKVTLGSTKIRPVRVAHTVAKAKLGGMSAYDVFGRKISTSARSSARHVLFLANTRDANQQVKRAIILR